jgi:tetratricopeptide (TPR) repeat protein
LPQHPEIATWLARALLVQGRQLELAEELLEEALAVAPELDLAEVLLAEIHRRTGRLDEARATLQAILANNPMHALALKELGAVDLLLDAPRQAEAHLRRALHFRPRDAQILNNLACALERQGQWSQALVTFTQAVEIAVNDPRLVRNRCIAQAACQRPLQMCEDAQTALLLSDHPQDELLTIRERLLDGGWMEALQQLETWSFDAGWSRSRGLPETASEGALETV